MGCVIKGKEKRDGKKAREEGERERETCTKDEERERNGAHRLPASLALTFAFVFALTTV